LLILGNAGSWPHVLIRIVRQGSGYAKRDFYARYARVNGQLRGYP
jgi:hypothetical protein